MDEVDYHNAQEEAGIGLEIRQMVCDTFGLGDESELSDEYLDRQVYKNTDCGAWLKFTETGIRIGSIVEGSDVDFVHDLIYPFTEEDIKATVVLLEEQVEEAWAEAHR